VIASNKDRSDSGTGCFPGSVLLSRQRTRKKISECLSRQGQRCISLDARRIIPVGIGVVMVEVIDQRVGYAPRDLRSVRSVEIGDGLATMYAIQSGELGPDLVGGRNS
jgi:hypothetical protein